MIVGRLIPAGTGLAYHNAGDGNAADWGIIANGMLTLMDSLNERRFTGTAIACHTIGGLCAGISANLLYRMWTMLL